MKLIKCACLVKVMEDQLLLVRVRDNELWYLPGGKIEEGENPRDALIRELKEELNIDLHSESATYLYTVTGPAYKQEADVELVCFHAEWSGEIQPSSEISEVSWISIHDDHLLAPAVIELVQTMKGLKEQGRCVNAI